MTTLPTLVGERIGEADDLRAGVAEVAVVGNQILAQHVVEDRSDNGHERKRGDAAQPRNPPLRHQRRERGRMATAQTVPKSQASSRAELPPAPVTMLRGACISVSTS